jgi:hypothetical protein
MHLQGAIEIAKDGDGAERAVSAMSSIFLQTSELGAGAAKSLNFSDN